MKPERVLDLIWLALLAATAVTWVLGANGWVGRAGLAGVVLVFALAWAKGTAVLLAFMELRHAPPAWRWGLAGALSAITGLIVLAYAVGQP